MKNRAIQVAFFSATIAFGAMAHAAPAPGIDMDADAPATGIQQNQNANRYMNPYAATPAQPNGAGTPATPALPGNPKALQETQRHRPDVDDITADQPRRERIESRHEIERPDVDRPDIDRPNRPDIQRPEIERPTMERPVI